MRLLVLDTWAGCSRETGCWLGGLHLAWWIWEETRICDIISWRCHGLNELREGFAPALREGGGMCEAVHLNPE